MEAIQNFKVFDSTMFHLEDTERAYLEYIEKLEKLSPRERNAFIGVLEAQEMICTQTIENENSFLMQLYSSLQTEDPITYVQKMFSGTITLDQVDTLHSMLIVGTAADKEQNARYRNGEYEADYDKWVGFYRGTEKVVQYIPPDPKYVMGRIQSIIHFMNDSSDRSLLYNIFIKPLIFHCEFAALQPFGDGNTRTARMLQYGSIWKDTKLKYGKSFSRPIIYLSHRYKLYAKNYRQFIQNVVVESGPDAWNRWFEFNLNMMDEALYKFDHDIGKVLSRHY